MLVLKDALESGAELYGEIKQLGSQKRASSIKLPKGGTAIHGSSIPSSSEKGV